MKIRANRKLRLQESGRSTTPRAGYRARATKPTDVRVRWRRRWQCDTKIAPPRSQTMRFDRAQWDTFASGGGSGPRRRRQSMPAGAYGSSTTTAATPRTRANGTIDDTAHLRDAPTSGIQSRRVRCYCTVLGRRAEAAARHFYLHNIHPSPWWRRRRRLEAALPLRTVRVFRLGMCTQWVLTLT